MRAVARSRSRSSPLRALADIPDMVVLSELVAVLNSPESSYVAQREKYE
jgi:hypothetical protein